MERVSRGERLAGFQKPVREIILFSFCSSVGAWQIAGLSFFVKRSKTINYGFAKNFPKKSFGEIRKSEKTNAIFVALNELTMKNADNITIFYENSFGIMCQWSGRILGEVGPTDKTIDIRFNRVQAFRYQLRETRFLLVTKTPIEKIGVGTDAESYMCFDDETIEKVLATVGENVSIKWQGGTLAFS